MSLQARRILFQIIVSDELVLHLEAESISAPGLDGECEAPSRRTEGPGLLPGRPCMWMQQLPPFQPAHGWYLCVQFAFLHMPVRTEIHVRHLLSNNDCRLTLLTLARNLLTCKRCVFPGSRRLLHPGLVFRRFPHAPQSSVPCTILFACCMMGTGGGYRTTSSRSTSTRLPESSAFWAVSVRSIASW